MSSINALPVDLLAGITALLDVEDLACLYMTGDMQLKRHLCHGGVKSLVLTNPLAFPRFVAGFHLKSLQIRIVSDGDTRIVIPGVDLQLLNPSIAHLELEFCTAFAKLLQCSRPVADLFPKLKTLTLPNDALIPANFEASNWFKELPNTLLHLSMPAAVRIKIKDLISLPCRLESLKVCLAKFNTGQEPEFALAKSFENLTKLVLRTEADVKWTHMVPSTVFDYSWQTRTDSMLAGSAMLALSVEDVFSLPMHLHSLSVSCLRSDALPLLQHLPKSIVNLHITSFFGAVPLPDDFSSILNFLPALRRLRTPAVHQSVLESAVLPPLLESWNEYHSSKPLKEMAALPATLTNLSLAELDDADVALLPDLKTLKITRRISLTPPFLAKLPKTLTTLRITEDAAFDAVLLRHLPATLRHFELKRCRLSMYGMKDAFWVKTWSANLETLRIEVSDFGTANLGPYFWRSLPPRLTSLWLFLPDLSKMPSTLAFLPRTLTSAHLSRKSYKHKTATITDSFFTDMPKKLRSLEMENFVFDLSPNFCLNLPKTMTWVQLDAHGAAGTNSPPQFDTSPERMPLLWEFLDKLPRHLCFRMTGAAPDFVVWQDKQKKDDLVEDCPNVEFWPLRLGTLRPHKTPSRRSRPQSSVNVPPS